MTPELSTQLSQIQQQLGELLKRQPPERPLTAEGAAQLLSISTSTVYQNLDHLPHYMRHGRLYFFESELLDYLKTTPGARKPRKTKA